MQFLQKDKYHIDDLLEIMRILRAPDGCPWDKQQTHESIRMNFIEETYEVAEAIDKGDTRLLKEELGDVLLQVVFHSQIESEKDSFDFNGVVDGICKKLIVRHPHIFADTIAETSAEVLKNWDDIKQKQKGIKNQSEALFDVPRTLPSLMRSEKVQQRAAKAGFDYADWKMALEHMHSEIRELNDAIAADCRQDIDEELGDLLFSVVNVSRFLKVNAEQSLEKACDKFIGRFAKVEELARQKNIDMKSADLDLLDILWGEVKNKES